MTSLEVRTWQDLRIYQEGPRPFMARAEGGVVRKRGRWQRFEYCFAAYALAARHAYEAGRLAFCVMPIAYMQRHSLELALKSLSGVCREIGAFREAQHKLESVKPEPVPYEHRFSEVLETAKADLANQRESLPQEFEDLARDFSEFDGDQPDRTRYDFYKVHRVEVPSFGNGVEIEVDILARQEALEALLEEHMSFFREEPHNLRTRLAIESDMQWQRMIRAFERAEILDEA